jgi:hypothetical protein
MPRCSPCYEAAQVLLVHSEKWSWLKAWRMRVAQRRGLRRAIVAVARRPGAVNRFVEGSITTVISARKLRWGMAPMILFPLLAALLPSSSLRRVLRLIAGLALLVLWPGQLNSTHGVNAPAKFLTDPDGAPARGPNNEMILKNWSGYAVTSGGYKSASASWTVPQVAFMSYPGGPSLEASATWVGIGGLSTSDLIQLGTGQIVAPNGATHLLCLV